MLENMSAQVRGLDAGLRLTNHLMNTEMNVRRGYKSEVHDENSFINNSILQ